MAKWTDIYTQPTLPYKEGPCLSMPATRFYNDCLRSQYYRTRRLYANYSQNWFELSDLRVTGYVSHFRNDTNNWITPTSTGSVDANPYKLYKMLKNEQIPYAGYNYFYDSRAFIYYYDKESKRQTTGSFPDYTLKIVSGLGNSIVDAEFEDALADKISVSDGYRPDDLKALYPYYTNDPELLFRPSSMYTNSKNIVYSPESKRTVATGNNALVKRTLLVTGKLSDEDLDLNSEGGNTIELLAFDQYSAPFDYLAFSGLAGLNNMLYVLKKYGFETLVLQYTTSGRKYYALYVNSQTGADIAYKILRATPIYITDNLDVAETYNIPLWNVPEIEGEGVWSEGVNIPNPDEPNQGGQPENEYEDAPSEWDPDNPNIDNSNESDTIEEGNPTIVPVGQTHRFYAMTTNQVDNLITFIWSPDVESGLRKVYNTPSDTIFSCRMYPLPIDEIANLGEPVNVKLGNLEATNSAGYLLNDVQCRYDMGSYHLKEYFGNFLDYGGHTKVEIYLPYIGFRNLDTDDVMGKVVSVSYIIDIVNGNCTAEVSADGNVVSVFDGNICVSLSIKSTNEDIIASQNRMVAVNTAVSGISSIISGASEGVLGAVGGAVSAVSSGLNSAVSIKNSRSNISRMGSASPFSNLYLPQEVFLVISRPRQSLPSNYGETYGYPCNITSQLNGVTGFTICDRVRLEGCPATREEKEAIINALSNGVIL